MNEAYSTTMRETETSAPSLGDVLDTRVDANVWTTAQILGEERLAQPEWLWFDEVLTSLGRWSRNSRQAPYVRADIAIASVTKAMAEAVASARAEGLKEGLERAAKIAKELEDDSEKANHAYDGGSGSMGYELACDDIEVAIRRLLPAPPTLIPGGRTDV